MYLLLSALVSSMRGSPAEVKPLFVPPAKAALFQPCVASVLHSAAGVQVPAGISRLLSCVRGAWLCNVV
jgi:hypothetical protein